MTSAHLRCCSATGVPERRPALRASRISGRLMARWAGCGLRFPRSNFHASVLAIIVPPVCVAHCCNALRCRELRRVRMTPMRTGSPSTAMRHPNVATGSDAVSSTRDRVASGCPQKLVAEECRPMGFMACAWPLGCRLRVAHDFIALRCCLPSWTRGPPGM